eukprot:snap_masked-scaffold_1-processed-gene-9.40-mRNA-1 protein AED:1.00 eAED:1.00 QI:0/0/0/0/1/1/2/0/88
MARLNVQSLLQEIVRHRNSFCHCFVCPQSTSASSDRQVVTEVKSHTIEVCMLTLYIENMVVTSDIGKNKIRITCYDAYAQGTMVALHA